MYLALIALIQGITEFLPISSSGHLVLMSDLTGHPDQGQLIDVAVHLGTLVAVVLYFWADMRRALLGIRPALAGRWDEAEARLVLCLVVATLPAIAFGLFLHSTGLDQAMRSAAVIGWTMLIFGIVLYWADRTGGSARQAEAWGYRDALLIGLAQALALIPGTSRSGITITAARRLGFDRASAARISMLMSVPVILASGTVLGADVVREGNYAAARPAGWAALLAFVAALIALGVMMRLLRHISFTPYVIYRVLFGAGLLVYAYLP